MSRHQTIKAIQIELSRLNRDIDLKIIKGLSYIRESKRHKFLKSQLSQLKPRTSWFVRPLSYLSAFMF